MLTIFCFICWMRSVFLRCERLHVNLLISFQHTMFVFCFFSLQTPSRARLFINHLFFFPLSCLLLLLFFDFCNLVPFSPCHYYFATKISLLSKHITSPWSVFPVLWLEFHQRPFFVTLWITSFTNQPCPIQEIDSFTMLWSTTFALLPQSVCFKCTYVWDLLHAANAHGANSSQNQAKSIDPPPYPLQVFPLLLNLETVPAHTAKWLAILRAWLGIPENVVSLVLTCPPALQFSCSWLFYTPVARLSKRFLFAMYFYSTRYNNAMIPTWALPTWFGANSENTVMLLLLLWEPHWLGSHQEIKMEAQICCFTDLQNEPRWTPLHSRSLTNFKLKVGWNTRHLGEIHLT